MTQQTKKNETETLVEVRCWNCGRLLGKIPVGTPYQFKCPKCKTMNEKEKTEMKIGDKVIDKNGYTGVVEHIWETGQISVQQEANVICTYDHANMLTVVEG